MMMLHENTLLIRDENSFGSVFNELKLNFDKVQVSIQDIITERVYQEVVKYNHRAAEYKYSLVNPKKYEVLLNTPQKKHQGNPEKQVEVALKALIATDFSLRLMKFKRKHWSNWLL
jgi:hypothetical protein